MDSSKLILKQVERRRWLHVATVAVVVLLSACQSDKDGYVAKIDRYVLREVIPADSVVVDVSLDLQFRFNRPADPSDVEVRWVPETVTDGTFSTSPSGQFLYLRGIELSDVSPRSQLILDGELFPDPVWLTYFTGNVEATHPSAVAGMVRTPDPSVDPAGAAVFAFRFDDIPNTIDPWSIWEISPISMDRITDYEKAPDRFVYAVYALPVDERISIAAIVDTSGDGIYEPDEDWWGIYRFDPSGNIGFAITCYGIICELPQLDFTVHPPNYFLKSDRGEAAGG